MSASPFGFPSLEVPNCLLSIKLDLFYSRYCSTCSADSFTLALQRMTVTKGRLEFEEHEYTFELVTPIYCSGCCNCVCALAFANSARGETQHEPRIRLALGNDSQDMTVTATTLHSYLLKEETITAVITS